MSKLPQQKKILMEDLKDAPSWTSKIIDPMNSFMDTVYSALNKNITFSENVSCFIKEISYKTPSTYPVMADFEFQSQLKTKATGVFLMQVVDSDYKPPTGTVYVPWIENNGTIIIKPITGLAASKTYNIRLLIS